MHIFIAFVVIVILLGLGFGRAMLYVALTVVGGLGLIIWLMLSSQPARPDTLPPAKPTQCPPGQEINRFAGLLNPANPKWCEPVDPVPAERAAAQPTTFEQNVRLCQSAPEPRSAYCHVLLREAATLLTKPAPRAAPAPAQVEQASGLELEVLKAQLKHEHERAEMYSSSLQLLLGGDGKGHAGNGDALTPLTDKPGS
jgi:hypothetical protein